ncbi:MAG: hypothetical protein EA397_05330 [Deltaproteobacteria bacterium]|nr:MAG: hypothetical protein EA397_05330 [Deltaproteobacteria bacterium]
MRWASTVNTIEDTEQAVRAAAEGLERAMVGARADLLLAFSTMHHRDLFPAVPALLRQRFPGAVVAGCSAHGVIGSDRQILGEPGLSVIAAHLPGVDAQLVHIDSRGEGVDVEGWRSVLPLEPLLSPSFLLFGTPRERTHGSTLAALDRAFPYGSKLGGLAGSGEEPSDVALFADGFVHRRGLVAVCLSGDLRAHPTVSMGARRAGSLFSVTRGKSHLLKELEGRPAHKVLAEAFERLSGLERSLFRAEPLVGVLSSQRGGERDYLVRRLVGIHPDSGVVVLDRSIEQGDRVCLFVKDAPSAHAEMRRALEQVAPRQPPPSGALLFTQPGRGEDYFGHVDHDLREVHRAWGGVATGGMVGSAAIGPIRGQTFLHHTAASAACFTPQGWN